MKIRKLAVSILLLGIMVMQMSGCQLAKTPVSGENVVEDRLVGVFITTDYIDLFNAEEYFVDKMNGKNVDMEDYRGRLYATPVGTELITNSHTGESEELVTEYEFKGVEGIKYIAIHEEDVAGMGYSSSCFDAPLAWTKESTVVRDVDTHSEYELKLESELFLSKTGLMLCINPVYKTAEGDIYAVNGSSCVVNTGGEGYSFNNKSVRTVNGFEETYSSTVSVNMTLVDTSEEYTLIFMDADSKEVSRTTYKSSEMPDDIKMVNGAEYIIVESAGTDENGNVITVRNLYDRKNNEIPSFRDRGDGICVKRLSEVVWE